MGPAYLVGRSQFRQQHDMESKLSIEDVNLQMWVAHFVSCLSRNQQISFALIMDGTVKAMKRQIIGNNLFCSDVPTSFLDSHTLIMEGRDVLLWNLPHPLVSLIDGHSYVSLFDVVANLLGHAWFVCWSLWFELLLWIVSPWCDHCVWHFGSHNQLLFTASTATHHGNTSNNH